MIRKRISFRWRSRRSSASARRFPLFGTDYPTPDGTAIRDYVHVVDLADAHLLALERIEGKLGAINLGARGGYSVRQIVDAVESVTGKKLPVTYGPRREGDPPTLIADASKAESALGWKPQRNLEAMISTAWDWMQRHPNGYAADSLIEGKRRATALARSTGPCPWACCGRLNQTWAAVCLE